MWSQFTGNITIDGRPRSAYNDLTFNGDLIMKNEIRAAQFQAAQASLAAFDCYRAAKREIIKGDRQIGQLWSRWGDMLMAVNAKANDDIRFLEWAQSMEEADVD
jgi:hypothetical protein